MRDEITVTTASDLKVEVINLPYDMARFALVTWLIAAGRFVWGRWLAEEEPEPES